MQGTKKPASPPEEDWRVNFAHMRRVEGLAARPRVRFIVLLGFADQRQVGVVDHTHSAHETHRVYESAADGGDECRLHDSEPSAQASHVKGRLPER